MYKNIYLKKGKDESLKRFHPWVFSGAIQRMDDGIEEGEVVRVINANGDFIAVGHYQKGTITVRVLSFEDIAIDDAFWEKSILSALNMRIRIGIADNPNNNTYRLIHGEGDYLPGLVIDCYGKTAVIQAHSVGMHYSRNEVCKALLKVMGGRIENVFYKSETTIPQKKDLHQEDGFLYGQEHYAKGKSVLNMFCYTGGFSVYAMRGGAKVVHSVDSSAKAIELTKRNIDMNFPGDGRHEAICDDAFDYLDSHDDTYDLIILDPPAFAKHRSALRNALKGYIRLNVKGLEKIKHGGILFTFSCSQVVTKENFRTAVFTAAAQAHRKVRILHQLHQPADHPINIYHPEGEYLKGLVLYVE